MLGFDVIFDPDKDDGALANLSRSDRRILLTRDRQLLMRSIVTRGIYVRNTDPKKQVLEIVERLDLYDQIHPFKRCINCNGVIRQVDGTMWESIQSKIPQGVKSWCHEFHVCDACGNIYWKGSHYKRMVHAIEQITRKD